MKILDEGADRSRRSGEWLSRVRQALNVLSRAECEELHGEASHAAGVN